ncbi:serine protease [Pedobacter yulinensis]|uniref:Serine protease n=1 Tax=Pedobacter yulinensis TaxID=2126353 RepID=A0A2T3HKI6_9SPHI|nr:S1C family serine protease [Pedobacter yulinensis]PST82901.1 serine protease [Pedobacter yulinensis]
MRRDLELDAIIEDYLNGKLSAAEQEAFEQLRSNDPEVDEKVVSHKLFLEAMGEYAAQRELLDKMDQIHADMDVTGLSAKLGPHPSKIVNFWRRNRMGIAVAASFILLCSMVVENYLRQSKQVGSYEQLDRKIEKVKRSQDNLIRTVNSAAAADPEASLKPGSFGGTGFAISANGYVLTNYHVISGADSLYLQNNNGDSFRATPVFTDSQNDIAILKIDDKNFSAFAALPYTLKKGKTGIGEVVYTLGFPKDDAVLGEGYVSSVTGFNSDSIQYQVAVPVNPGNSGGPLLDNSGNIVGMISGKDNRPDGAAFAVKSKYILEAINSIPADSLNKKIAVSKRNLLSGLKRTQQVEKLQDYVFMVKVYKD